MSSTDFTEIYAKDKYGRTSLHWAAGWGLAEVSSAIGSRTDVTDICARTMRPAQRSTVLHWRGHSEVCSASLARRDFTEIIVSDQVGGTALHSEAETGFAEVSSAIMSRKEGRRYGDRFPGSPAIHRATRGQAMTATTVATATTLA
jgi:ankyrin repeat protein